MVVVNRRTLKEVLSTSLATISNRQLVVATQRFSGVAPRRFGNDWLVTRCRYAAQFLHRKPSTKYYRAHGLADLFDA